VRDANGKTHTLNELRGKKSLLITFFPRCFTGNCTSQLTSLRDAYPQLQKAGVEVWAVSTDGAAGPHGQRAFAKYLRLPFVLVPDPDRKLCLQFGAVRTKEQIAARMSVLIDKTGQVLWIDKQISPRTHGADVLSRLQAPPVLSASPSPASATTSSPIGPQRPSDAQDVVWSDPNGQFLLLLFIHSNGLQPYLANNFAQGSRSSSGQVALLRVSGGASQSVLVPN